MVTKLNNKYEFDMKLNLKEFTYSEMNYSDEDCEYKLVGVVLHRGNAEYGHYTSLIDVDRKDPRRKID